MNDLKLPNVVVLSYLKIFFNCAIAGSIFSVGEALLLFLESLPEPVVPYRFQSKCMDASQNYTLCKQVCTLGLIY